MLRRSNHGRMMSVSYNSRLQSKHALSMSQVTEVTIQKLYRRGIGMLRLRQDDA